MDKILPKKVSNYELFYDLVFALALASLTGMMHHVSGHMTIEIFVKFLLTAFVILKLWAYETIYLNIYGERDMYDIFTIIAKMFLVGYLAKEVTLDWDATFFIFNTLYILVGVIILLQYFLRAKQRGQFDSGMLTQMKVIGIDIGAVALGVILVFTRVIPIHPVLMTIVFCMPFVPMFLVKQTDTDATVNFPHLLERVQLITILSFGEAVLAVIRTYDLKADLLPASLLFLMVGCLFMVFITQTALLMDHHRTKGGRILLYIAFLIVTSVLIVTIGIEWYLHHQLEGLQMLSIGLVMFYVGVAALSVYNHDKAKFTVQHALVYSFSFVILLVLGMLTQELLFFFLSTVSVVIYTYYRVRKTGHSPY